MEGGDYFSQEKALFDDALDCFDRFEAGVASTFGELSVNELVSPLLNHVGVVDINKAWEAVSRRCGDDLAQAYRKVGNFPVYSARLELEEQLSQELALPGRAFVDIASEEYNQRRFETLQNEFYPVAEGSFIAKLARTSLWRRTLGIPQLGWKDNYPLKNAHSRGAHQLFAAVNMARVLQGLSDTCPDELAARLRQDFSQESFYDESMTNEELALLATDLAVVVGMAHDIYTPAGGDMMKHIMDMDEEKDASKLLGSGDRRVEKFLAVLEEQGLNKEHLVFVVDCIQGASTSLVGEMIHREDEDVLEQDRLAYTVQDLFSCGILGPAVARELLARDDLRLHEDGLIEAQNKAAEALASSSTYVAGTIAAGPSLSLLDVSDDYILNDSKLVCTRPDKLVWLAAFRAIMSAEFYQGAKLRGQEHELSLILEKIKESGKAAEILTSSNLSRVDNRELEEQMREVNSMELESLFADMDKIIYPRSYESKVLPLDEVEDDDWFTLPISIKPGLDTAVMDEGEVMPLGVYMQRHPASLPVRLLTDTLNTYHEKKRVIRRVE